MQIDYDVKSARDRHDFASIEDGASIWFPSKGEALSLRAAFIDWDKSRMMETTIEKVGAYDPRGRGYRIYFRAIEIEQRDAAGSLEVWIMERTKPTARPPLGGWRLVSALHADYEQWFGAAGLPANRMLSIVKFSKAIAAMPEITRKRVSEGSIAIGLALKDDEIFAPRPRQAVDRSDEFEQAAAGREDRLRAITSPCQGCGTTISAIDLNNNGKCPACVEQDNAPVETGCDPEASFRAKLEAKRKADRGR